MPEDIKKGIGYTGVSQLISMGLKFTTSIVLARGLGSASFGLYNVFQSGVETLSWMLDFGGNSTITKFIADADADQDPKKAYSSFSSTLVWHGLLIFLFWAVLALFSNQIRSIWFDGDTFLYILFAITVPAAVICGDIIGALYGLRELKYIAVRMVTQQGLVTLGSIILILWLGFGVRIAALIIAAVWIILCIGLVRIILDQIRKNRLFPNPRLVLTKTLNYSLPIGGVYVIETAIRYAPVLLVKAFNQGDPNVNKTVASLALAVFFAGAAESVIQFLARSGFGYLGRWHHLKENHLFISYVLSVSIFAILVFLLMGIVIKFGLPLFVTTIYGVDYLGVQIYIYLTLLGSFFRSLTYIFRISLYVMGNTIKVFLSSVIEILLYVGVVVLIAKFDPNPNWGIRFLQIAAVSSSIRVLLLILFSVNTFRNLESRSILSLFDNAKSITKQTFAFYFQRNNHK